MKVRSSSRGLKITSLVVLSPVLLILFSLVYIFLVFVYSNIMSWCHPTIQPLSSQSSLARVTTSSTVSIYHHHCSSKLPQITILKRVNFFARLRQSPLVWCAILLIYALYTVHKKKKSSNDDDPDTFYQEYTEEETVTMKPNKQQRRKKTKHSNNKQQHQKSSTEQQRHSKPMRSYSPVKTPELESDDDNTWISVGEIRKKKHKSHVHRVAVLKTVTSSEPKYEDDDGDDEEEEMNIMQQVTSDDDDMNSDDSQSMDDNTSNNDNDEEDSISNDDDDDQLSNNEHDDYGINNDNNDPIFSDNIRDDDNNEECSPEDENSSIDFQSPITSEDESEEKVAIRVKRRSWYSPFSTGLDLDILQKRPDPFVHYKFDTFMLPPPISFKSNLELLQNHPFIPTSKNEEEEQHVQHTLGPIGGSVRSTSFVHF